MMIRQKLPAVDGVNDIPVIFENEKKGGSEEQIEEHKQDDG